MRQARCIFSPASLRRTPHACAVCDLRSAAVYTCSRCPCVAHRMHLPCAAYAAARSHLHLPQVCPMTSVSLCKAISTPSSPQLPHSHTIALGSQLPNHLRPCPASSPSPPARPALPALVTYRAWQSDWSCNPTQRPSRCSHQLLSFYALVSHRARRKRPWLTSAASTVSPGSMQPGM
jgi:hypothetical protein